MNRKDAAYLRIIVWSIVAAALLIILIVGIIFGHNFSFSFISFEGDSYKNSEKYIAGGGEVPAGEVDSLDVNWTSGKVEIAVYEGDTIRMEETAGRELSEREKLHYFNDNGTLRIQFQESGKKFRFISADSGVKKTLKLEIPREKASQLKQLSVDTASADTDMSYISGKEMILDTASGNFRMREIQVEKLRWDTVSGDLEGENLEISEEFIGDSVSGRAEFTGAVGEIDFDSVSGDMKVTSTHCPDKVRTDTVSGEIRLRIPENSGFTYEMDGVSGKVHMDFPVLQNGNGGVYKDGQADFSFETVSGDVSVEIQD